MAEICREELEQASHRINERLSEFECASTGDDTEGVRRFYEDLVDRDWTEADEEFFNSLDDKNEKEIKAIMREAFRRSRIHPAPNFAYLMNLMNKAESDHRAEAGNALANPYAVSAPERERMASLLEKELAEAAGNITSRLQMDDARAKIVGEELEMVAAHIIGHFTPLA